MCRSREIEQTVLATHHNNSNNRSCMVRRNVQKPSATVLRAMSDSCLVAATLYVCLVFCGSRKNPNRLRQICYVVRIKLVLKKTLFRYLFESSENNGFSSEYKTIMIA